MLYQPYYSELPWCHLTAYSEYAQPDTNLVDPIKKIKHLMDMEHMKLFAKNWKRTGNYYTQLQYTVRTQEWNLAEKKVSCFLWKVANDI